MCIRDSDAVVPRAALALRPLWYFSTRAYAYGLFFCSHRGAIDPSLLALCAPMVLHNACVLRRQVVRFVRR